MLLFVVRVDLQTTVWRNMGCPSRCDQFTTSTRYSFNRGLFNICFSFYNIEICWEKIMHSCLILLRWRPNLVRILRSQWTTTKFDFKHFLSNFSVSCKSPWWYRLATFADFPSEPCMSSQRTLWKPEIGYMHGSHFSSAELQMYFKGLSANIACRPTHIIHILSSK